MDDPGQSLFVKYRSKPIHANWLFRLQAPSQQDYVLFTSTIPRLSLLRFPSSFCPSQLFAAVVCPPGNLLCSTNNFGIGMRACVRPWFRATSDRPQP